MPPKQCHLGNESQNQKLNQQTNNLFQQSSTSQANIDTNNVNPCAKNNNKKVINSSNSTSIQNFTRVDKQVNIIKYATSGRTMFGNINPFLGQTPSEYMNIVLATRNNVNVTNNQPIQYTLNASINNQSLGSGLGNALINPDQNPNLFIRCSVPPPRKCIKPFKNKF